ncbi:hypothetical protein B0H13DRAFT_2375773 [Mycena leptocephala]|nr:hypothetical protein B0H13DRAFT_2375773 [Mycena leptocephala]
MDSTKRARRARRRPPANNEARGSQSSQVNVTSHTFSASEFRPVAERAINTFVDRASGDQRRIYRDIISIEPPSPIKKARATAWQGSNVNAEFRPRVDEVVDDRYEMFGDDWDANAADPPVPTLPKIPRKRGKGIYSDTTLYNWKNRSRDCYLLELLQREGCADASETQCPGCEGQNPTYRCRECKGGELFCGDCCVRRHLANPLHIIEAWTGERFARTTLQAIGMIIQFGHPPGEYCANPTPGRKGFVVIHETSIQEVSVNFCGCENGSRAGAPDVQLLRGGWYPASEERPQTCMTLEALRTFHMLNLQAKTTMYDFYQTLEKLTSNNGQKPPNRYQVFIRIMREYRHLKMLKRRGRGHHRDGVAGTKPGELAVLCPACPRPGVNLPDEWEKASKEQRFIYVLFLAIDACFRMKRGLVSSELKDPGLGTGMAYMVEDGPYRDYLLTVTEQKEISTCSGLAALDYANTKFSRGYSTTGVGMAVCARHEFIQPNGVGDLQKGERFANMDYIVASLLRHHDPLLRKVLSYDIVCQWWKKLMERLRELPELVRCFLILPMVAFVIPKLHIHAHTILCNTLYSLNLIPGSGQTDGEGIERPWANIGGIASSTRIMGPGARHDTVDDHWGHWNWQKLVSLPETLRRRLDRALEQQIVQMEALASFSAQQQERADIWKTMVHDYEDDSSKKNPYEAVVTGGVNGEADPTAVQQEEEADAKKGVPAKHKVSPSTFMAECLEVEEEQRRVRVQAELKKAQSTAQQIDMGAMRTKLIRRLERLRKLQGTYTPASILALENRDARADELPENEPLFLPSALSEAERSAGLSDSAGSATQPASHQGAILNYKKLHARHQGANTRSRTIVNRNERWRRIKGRWRRLKKEDIRCMEDADDLARKEEKRKRAQLRRKRKLQELVDHGVEVSWENGEEEDEEEEGPERRKAGESRREVSWIWTAAGTSGTDADLEDALRIEWCKAYARSRRWNEEVAMLREEFRRIPISLTFEAELWIARGKAVPILSPHHQLFVALLPIYIVVIIVVVTIPIRILPCVPHHRLSQSVRYGCPWSLLPSRYPRL